MWPRANESEIGATLYANIGKGWSVTFSTTIMAGARQSWFLHLPQGVLGATKRYKSKTMITKRPTHLPCAEFVVFFPYTDVLVLVMAPFCC